MYVKFNKENINMKQDEAELCTTLTLTMFKSLQLKFDIQFLGFVEENVYVLISMT